MPQQQKIIPLIFKNDVIKEAIATGNNASWHCKCLRTHPLLGKSGQLKGVSEGTKVVCPDCRTEYFVVPDGGDYKRSLQVIEV